MTKKQNKHKRRVRNLGLICTFTAIVLLASTFAWFVGMRTVKVNSFNVEIAAVDSLKLSLDGVTWSDSINVDTLKAGLATSYPKNTNVWATKGLVPVSSVGDVDTTASTMKMYEKGSLGTTAGGYRLLASQVPNSTVNTTGGYTQADETEGYVAFDLFIHNSSGREYYTGARNVNNEEPIYLTVDSGVTVGTSGVENTGIENSVRVAFAQIGRTMATDLATTDKQTQIQNLKCSDTDGGTKGNSQGLCQTATIWEPNDTAHIADAIGYYNNSCLARTAASTYSGSCGTITNGKYYTTNAISRVIDLTSDPNLVDIYDGSQYNGYTTTLTAAEGYTPALVSFETFTDTDKLKTGTDRPTFFTLAPNSVTKVRVYIYIEGQDIDNYDYAQIGKQISVKFGFTKERFNEEDTNYAGPVTNEGFGPYIWDEEASKFVEAADTTAPVISLAAAEGLTGATFENDTLTLTALSEEAAADFDIKDYVTASATDKKTTYTCDDDTKVCTTTTSTNAALTTGTTTTYALTNDTTIVEDKQYYSRSITGGKYTYAEADATSNPKTEGLYEVDETFNYGTISNTDNITPSVAGDYQIVYTVTDANGNVATKVLNVKVNAGA